MEKEADNVKMKIYEDVFDFKLVRQMRRLIFEVCDRKDKISLYNEQKQHSLIWIEEETEGMEDAYGLRYPGEVLERYAEKIRDSAKVIRSLALALTEMKPFLEQGMFIGNQYGVFMKKIQNMSEKDLYLLGACYILEESPEKKLKLRSGLIERGDYELAEMVYLLYLFQDDEAAWDGWKHELSRLLGSDRKIDIYGNEDLYAWIIQYCVDRFKGYRKNDLHFLRGLCRLHSANSNGKNMAKKWMSEGGYSEEEILYLNLVLPERVNMYDSISVYSITAERLAVEACVLFLNGTEERPEAVYDLCRKLLDRYRKYEVKLNGNKGIFGSLQGLIKVGSIGAYMALFPFKEEPDVEQNSLYINLLEPKWDVLKDLLTEQEYQQQVCRTLAETKYTAGDLRRCLEHYQELAGEELYQIFWKSSQYPLSVLFAKLAQNGEVDALQIVKEYLEDCEMLPERERKQKWNEMLRNIRDYAFSLENRDSFEIFQLVDRSCGIENLDDIFNTYNIIGTCFGIQNYGRHFGGLQIIRSQFSTEENRKLLRLAEKYVYRKKPDYYEEFVYALLSDEENDILMDEEERRDCAEMLMDSMQDTDWRKEDLREKYYTEQEMEEYRIRKQMQKEQMEEEKRERIRQEEKQGFDQFVLEHAGNIPESLNDFLRGKFGFPGEIAAGLVKNYLLGQYGRESVKLSRQGANKYLDVLKILYDRHSITLEELKTLVNHMEVAEDVSNNQESFKDMHRDEKKPDGLETAGTLSGTGDTGISE